MADQGQPTAPIKPHFFGSSRFANAVALLSLSVAIAALAVAIVTAQQSHLSAVTGFATARPIVHVHISEVVPVADVLRIPIRIVNSGKTGADIEYVRLVNRRNEDGSYHYHECRALRNAILRAEESISACSITANRFEVVDGQVFDLTHGVDDQGRLQCVVKYKGRELDSASFEEWTAIPVTWKFP